MPSPLLPHYLLLTISLLLLLLPLTLTHSLTLTYTPLHDSTPPSHTHPLAHLTLSPPTLLAYTPPPPSSSLIRLSFSSSTTSTNTSSHPHTPDTPSESSTLLLASALHLPGSHFRVLLSRFDNCTLGVGLHPDLAGVAGHGGLEGSGGLEVSAWPTVRIAYAAPPPRPVLNKPVVVSADGTAGEEGAGGEKTFLQK
ncbi:hypothetical protein MMC34_006631 [Xylographa carneopallida]|nr:hypothetical protein [Xylographa carneopallida]